MALCQFRSNATCGLQAEAAGAEFSASHKTVETFLAGLQYEASKGYINIKVCIGRDLITGQLHAARVLKCNTHIASEEACASCILVSSGREGVRHCPPACAAMHRGGRGLLTLLLGTQSSWFPGSAQSACLTLLRVCLPTVFCCYDVRLLASDCFSHYTEASASLACMSTRHACNLCCHRLSLLSHVVMLLNACAAFQKYELLSARDRRSVVDEAIREVQAQESGSANDNTSANSQRGQQQAEHTASDTHTAGSQPVHDRQRPKVSSMKNLVRVGSQDEASSRALSSERHSTAALQESVQQHGRLGDDGRPGQESKARMSQKHRSLRLMTAEGAGAELLSSADAAGVSADPSPPRAVSAAASQLQQGPRGTHASEVGRGLPGSSGMRPPSGQLTGAGAVLVGEDEEFSVNSGEPCQTLSSLVWFPLHCSNTPASHELQSPGYFCR